MVNKELVLKIPIAYRAGYKDRVAAADGMLQLEVDMNLTKQIPAPIVLPYTDEECEPLPPKEFEDNKDDGLKEGDVDKAADDGAEAKAANDEAEAKVADDGADTIADHQRGADGENLKVD